MIDQLKFVSRGIAKSDQIHSLTHFAIHKGRVTGFNGALSLSAPLPLSFDAAPAAIPFLRALDACEETISITQESASKIVVRSGTFKASVPCLDLKTIPKSEPEGVSLPCTGIVAAFTTLKPFICTNPDRPALCSVLFREESAYATNNICVVQYWLGFAVPNWANVPVDIVDEVLRNKEEPVRMQLSDTSITFHYPDGRWIKCQLNSAEWPNLGQVLDIAWKEAKLVPVAEELREGCRKLGKYVGKSGGKTYFRGTDVATAKEDSEDGIATVATATPGKGCYWTKYLSDVLQTATMADFEKFPKPVPFVGDKVRGAIVGVVE